ncbi:hypothetical protein Y032_0002g921 [Ancylostoma ceylanicum]|uniref:G-protein coupled receptors family 1 profile domain-containing protein n=1 Tax=Ancylostoma ceylanicum TaxID=53326 RepID=A0A016W1E4_9BILA|nr:hypothetical protein Y032_0002g921 [Ancylostoma ceylanicum]
MSTPAERLALRPLFYRGDVYTPFRMPSFQNDSLLVAAALMMTTDVICIAVIAVFILSIRKLCGWSTHFSFTCLLCISITGIYYLIAEIVCITVGLSGLLVLQNFYLYRVIGIFTFYTSYFLPIFHIYLAIHRVITVCFPHVCHVVFRPAHTKIAIGTAVCIHLFVVALNLTDLAGVIYVPRHLSFTFLHLPYTNLLISINRIMNWVMAVLHILVYPAIMFVLYSKNFRRHGSRDERSITAQIASMVLIEIVFFIIWSFVKPDGAAAVLTKNFSNSLYCAFILLPYLFMNGSIKREALKLFRGDPKKVRSNEVARKKVPQSFVMSRSPNGH